MKTAVILNWGGGSSLMWMGLFLDQDYPTAGFDWTEDSLGDISILANTPEMSFQITVMDWEGPVIMTVTI
ncbi:MAG: hypothetical protein J5646_02210 [Bacteroidales bacterium]|nr:hypothetical protein [Bacteroidales bacterium]